MKKTMYFMDNKEVVLVVPRRYGYAYKSFKNIEDVNSYITEECDTDIIRDAILDLLYAAINTSETMEES